MNPTQVIGYLESHPLDEDFVKILQRDYEFDVYFEPYIDSFLFYHYGQMASGGTIDENVEYSSPSKSLPRLDYSIEHWPTLRRTATGRLDTSEFFRREPAWSRYSATIETYQDPDGERGLRFKYYWITLIGEDSDEMTGHTFDFENPLEDYFSDPNVREEYTYGIDEWYGEYEFAEFDLPYRFPTFMLNYPRGGIFG